MYTSSGRDIGPRYGPDHVLFPSDTCVDPDAITSIRPERERGHGRVRRGHAWVNPGRSVMHETELVAFRIDHDDPSSPGVHDLVADTGRAECDQPLALGVQVVADLDVDVKAVLAG